MSPPQSAQPKLGLGTAQFGFDYGVSNAAGKTVPAEVRRILALADAQGIGTLDTAPGYGDSETVLGECIEATQRFDIVTKTPAFDATVIGPDHAAELIGAFERSLATLRRPAVYGLLIHSATDLLRPGGELLIEAMTGLKARGLVRKIGVSVYNAKQIDAILERYVVDLVQAPVSLLDQRLLASGHLAALGKSGVEVHVRSVFLQGLLLMAPSELPAYFASVKGHLAAYREFLRGAGLSPVHAALGFALSRPEIDRVIVGVNSLQQLQEIASTPSLRAEAPELRRFALDDPAIVDPSLWRLG
jgi:aryl-alcohol dehydrogenase-like predicted oxidoreductase